MEKPTPQQINAYRFVFIHDCTQAQAALLMGCSRPNVTQLIKRLKKSNPQLFLNNKPKIHLIQYHTYLNSQIIDKF